MSGATGRWLRRLSGAAQTGTRMVCFPHAGGAAGYYSPLAGLLAPYAEIFAVQYPGRQERWRETPIEDISDLADQVFQVLEGWGDRPLAFFGHSMGAVVAYEVARRLEHKAGIRLRVLFVSGRRAPSRERPERVHLGDDDAVVAELVKLNGTDARLLEDEELRQLVLPAVRADFAAIERYRRPPGPDPTCPISVLTGDADPLTTAEEARAWAEHTTAGADMRIFSGGHFFLGDHQEEIARLVSQRLATP